MAKYRVRFARVCKVQIDGWSDWRDTEYRIDRYSESITVEAKNLALAKKTALKKSRGYPAHGARFGDRYGWTVDDIKSIKRLPKTRK